MMTPRTSVIVGRMAVGILHGAGHYPAYFATGQTTISTRCYGAMTLKW
jgi:hypothetical protein